MQLCLAQEGSDVDHLPCGRCGMSFRFAARWWTVALLVVLLAPIGCRHPDSATEIDVALSVEPSPPTVGPAKLTLTLKDQAGSPVEGATLKLEGNMNHAGMKP